MKQVGSKWEAIGAVFGRVVIAAVIEDKSYHKSDSISPLLLHMIPCLPSLPLAKGKKYVGSLSDTWSLGVILFAMVCGYVNHNQSCFPNEGVLRSRQ